MKQLLTVLLLLGLALYGHFAIPHFDSYLIMMGLISVLVIAHELGHFFVAKRVGVKVERFGFGLPIGPTLLEKKFGETTICLHPVLLGGYVSFPDDDPSSDVPADSPRRFENRSILERSAIAVAGVTVNFILGYLIMVFVIARWGYPGDYLISVKEFVSQQAPAVHAGLQPGDKFVEVAGKPIKATETLVDHLHQHPGQPVQLKVLRQGKEQTLTVTPDEKGMIGVSLVPTHHYQPVKQPLEVLTKAYTFLQEKILLNFQAMGQIFAGERSAKEVSGPIGIIKGGGDMIRAFGMSDGLVITALISVILAVMNILPIPMLDGGHLLFMLIEKLNRGRPLRKEVQERVIQVSFMVLIGLMGLILWNDVHTYILR